MSHVMAPNRIDCNIIMFLLVIFYVMLHPLL